MRWEMVTIWCRSKKQMCVYCYAVNTMSISEKQLKSLLQNEKAALLKANETGGEAEQVVELDQTRVGRLSRMDAMQSQAMSLETGRRRRRRLLDIASALERIDGGNYGYCFDCDELISPGRLKANPAAERCIGCAESNE